ncbi:DUF6461 domain-containing protein [Streptomyces shenzhenensis]|uniref:DUF6461 domain-containing protein n=1 Tax=Streptomyces shenzhenensis TaxID=943815 RepID=UPI0036789EA4
MGDWSFCFEDYGVMGRMPGPLSALSCGRETLSVLRGGDGMSGFAYWQDGRCAERFEPGAHPPHPWWDAVQTRLDASGEVHPGLVPVLESTAHHTRVVLDTNALDGPLLTLRLKDSERTPDPQTRREVSRPPQGVLGVPVRPGPPRPPATGQAANVPSTRHTHGVRDEE